MLQITYIRLVLFCGKTGSGGGDEEGEGRENEGGREGGREGGMGESGVQKIFFLFFLSQPNHHLTST